VYKLFEYARMIADQGRTQAYAESLRRCVTSSSVVVDIGTGTGVFALLAARLGARKVYAIDPSDAIQFGPRIAAENGLDRRIEFIHGISTQIQLPERADVIVAEIHGILPAHQRSLFSLMDARDRFLAAGGCLIPRRETLWAAVVEATALHEQTVGVWGKDILGIDMTAVASTAANTWHKSRMQPHDLVTSPQCWANLDYAALRSPHVRGTAAWEISERRIAHGIAAWFDWHGADGVAFSNSPLSGERHIFGQAFFPWPEPLELCRDDQVRVELRSDSVGSEYVYGWETIVRGKDGRTKAALRQSDFFGRVWSADRLRQRSSTAPPAPTEGGLLDQRILRVP
jgi:protein arginine N-methyltransferase 1